MLYGWHKSRDGPASLWWYVFEFAVMIYCPQKFIWAFCKTKGISYCPGWIVLVFLTIKWGWDQNEYCQLRFFFFLCVFCSIRKIVVSCAVIDRLWSHLAFALLVIVWNYPCSFVNQGGGFLLGKCFFYRDLLPRGHFYQLRWLTCAAVAYTRIVN